MSDDADERPTESAADPARRAVEKADEIRLYAEIAAVFEGTRKFDARVRPGLDADVARRVQRGMATLEKQKPASGTPVLPPEAAAGAADLLNAYEDAGLSTGDYHVYRRPGEVMIARWLAGDEVETFYERLQAHFDAALTGLRDELRQDEWKHTAADTAYLATLDAMQVDMAGRYSRDAVRRQGLFMLSTQTADEMNIAFLCDHVMGIDPADLVGRASAPQSDQPAERELAWFYKQFLLRGVREGVEQVCFFTYLQKTDDESDFDE